MKPYIGEFLGMAMLILMGNSGNCTAKLQKSHGYGAGNLEIMFGWALAVMIPGYIFGNISGAHFNPVISMAKALVGDFAWSMVPGYIVAQIAGALCGQLLVVALFKDHFLASEEGDLRFGCFATSASIPNFPRNLLSEIVGTTVLVLASLAAGTLELVPGLGSVYTFCLIAGIGMSFTGLTGYAINPARDLGPRIAYALCKSVRGKDTPRWSYLPVPICGPIIGGLVGTGLYVLLF